MLSKDPDPLLQGGGDSPPVRQIELSANERFFRYFQEQVTDLQEKISQLPTTPTVGGEQVDATDYCLAAIARLSDETKDAFSYTPTYDQRVYAESLKALHEKFAEAKEAIAPRKKFAFKRDRRPTPTTSPLASITVSSPATLSSDQGDSEDKAVDTPRDSPGSDSLTAPRDPSVVSFEHIRDAHIIIPDSAPLTNTSAAANDVTRCVVDMSSSPEIGRSFANFTIKNAITSLFICGKIDGAAYITGVKDSVIVASCQQFRMHDCYNVQVYLSCGSKPIIEDCTCIRFSALPDTYSAQNGKKTDLWSLVEDFKWLKDEQSPNWSIMDPEDVVPELVWEHIAINRRNLSMIEIFRATNVVNLVTC